MENFFIVSLKLKKAEALATSDVNWWIRNTLSSKKIIDHGKIDHILYTDASNQGWGTNLNSVTTESRWTTSEGTHRIKSHCL